jgi:diaminopimelate epimerase
MVNGKTDRLLAVHAPGGKIDVIWREDGEVVMTGRADIVFSGEWLGD